MPPAQDIPWLYRTSLSRHKKEEIVNNALKEAEDVARDFRRGLLTEQEQNERTIEIWQRTTNLVADEVKKAMDPNGNLAAQAISGATKGGFGPISQLAGMRGLMADPSGRIIPLPIRSNFREGLNASGILHLHTRRS